jgi:hypothetical protein
MNIDLASVLYKAWRGGFSTKSRFAREFTNEIAAAASLGLITTKIDSKAFGTKWFITKTGLEVFDECYKE